MNKISLSFLTFCALLFACSTILIFVLWSSRKQNTILKNATEIFLYCFVIYINFVLTNVASALILGIFHQDLLIKRFIISTLITLFFVLVSLSPLSEKITKFLYTRRLSIREKNYLMPIVEEIYQRALNQKMPPIKYDIRVFPSYNMNAYALGSSTVILTKGLIQNATPYQIKGVIAHEFGHLKNLDGERLAFFYTLNFLTLAYVYVACVLKIMLNMMGRVPLVGGLMLIFMYSFVSCSFIGVVAIKIYNKMVEKMLLLFGQNAEYLADSFAKQIGYAHNLADYLDQHGHDNRSGVLLFSSHPDTELRIEALIYK